MICAGYADPFCPLLVKIKNIVLLAYAYFAPPGTVGVREVVQQECQSM